MNKSIQAKPQRGPEAVVRRLPAPDIRVLQEHIAKFPQVGVLVVGDLILDHYIWGKVNRISPEAPVPVVHVSSESLKLGGAANVYNNIVSLGGRAYLCGVVGADEGGRQLLQQLGTTRHGRGGIVIDPDRTTTRKTRVISRSCATMSKDGPTSAHCTSGASSATSSPGCARCRVSWCRIMRRAS